MSAFVRIENQLDHQKQWFRLKHFKVYYIKKRCYITLRLVDFWGFWRQAAMSSDDN